MIAQRTISTSRPCHVTRIGAEGPSAIPIEAIWDGVEGLYSTGLYPAIGLSIRHRGEVVLDRTIGHVDNPPGGAPGAMATPATLFSLFSASKILTAVLVHALVEDGFIDLDDPVAKHIGGFGRHGKGGILIRHLLSHTAGIPSMPAGLDVQRVLDERRVDIGLLCDLVPETKPGATAAYHPCTSWLLLQEICESRTGKPLRELAHDRLLGPLGFEHMNYGVSPEELDRVARHHRTGPPVAPLMRRIFERTIGCDLDLAIELSNTARFLTETLPMANVCTTGREMTRFLQMLLNGGELDGVRVLRRATVRRAVSEATRVQLDGTFGFPMRYSLGMMMGGNRFSLFGLTTRGAFGHLGFSNVIVYGDPSRDLAVSFLNTGKPLLAPGMLRWQGILQRIALSIPRR